MTTQLSKETLRKMLVYTKTAAGLLAIGTKVNAQGVYTDVNPDVTLGFDHEYAVDFDGATGYEFRLFAYSSYNSQGFRNFANSFQFMGADAKATPLAHSTIISSGQVFISNENRTSGLINFIDQGDRYMGCRFKISGAWHYGWVRVSVTRGNIIVKDFAYNSTTDGSINAGIVTMAPTIAANTGITLNEGATLPITKIELSATDADSDDATLAYTITTVPTNGQVENSDNAGVSITSFTQQNLIDGKIQYVHNGSNTTSDSFTFKVSDGVIELTGQTFSIAVNAVDDDAPTISANAGLTLDEGATLSITTTELSASDTEADDATLAYTITTEPTNGQVENSDNAGVAITSFTQQNLIDGKIQYVHNGSNTTSDSFTFKVSDGTNELTGQTFSIAVNAVDDDAPTISVNAGLTLDEGATLSITTTELSASDTDSDDATLAYTITTTPTNGQVENSDDAGVAITSFTQQNLIDGKIQYVHNGSNTTSDSFTFKVSDGTNELIDQTFTITINPVTGLDAITNTSLKLWPTLIKNVVHIQSESIILQVDVYDLAGKSILNETVNSVQHELRMDGQIKGVYMLKIKTSEDVFIRKIVKK